MRTSGGNGDHKDFRFQSSVVTVGAEHISAGKCKLLGGFKHSSVSSTAKSSQPEEHPVNSCLVIGSRFLLTKTTANLDTAHKCRPVNTLIVITAMCDIKDRNGCNSQPHH